MKRFILACLIVSAIACHPPATIVTPQGKAAFTSDQVVIRVNELGNAAIAAQANGVISVDTTRLIVQFCLTADQTLGATPNGWQASVLAAWTSVKMQLPASVTTNVTLSAAIAAVDVVLAAIGN